VGAKWQAYFELLRFPAVFTAVADVLMGYLVTQGGLQPWHVFALLVLSSSCLYLAGMVLNDVFDAEIDARDRPTRPIPSGRISRSSAYRVGWFLMGAGYGAAWVIFLTQHDVGPAAVAGVLALFVYLYDRGLKRVAIGPVVMGLCRALNVLLGMSFVGMNTGMPLASRLTPTQLAIPFGIWIYIAIVTWFAKKEATSPSIQSAVRYMLRAIIVIDAAIVLGFCGPGWAAAVLALLVPMLFLERWASTT